MSINEEKQALAKKLAEQARQRARLAREEAQAPAPAPEPKKKRTRKAKKQPKVVSPPPMERNLSALEAVQLAMQREQEQAKEKELEAARLEQARRIAEQARSRRQQTPAAPAPAPAVAPARAPAPRPAAVPAAPSVDPREGLAALLSSALDGQDFELLRLAVVDERKALRSIWSSHQQRFLRSGNLERAAMVAGLLRAMDMSHADALLTAEVQWGQRAYLLWADLNLEMVLCCLPDAENWSIGIAWT